MRAIGQLDADQECVLKAMEPKLAGVYGMAGHWYDIVAAQMDFPEQLPTEILRIWQTGYPKAEEQGFEPDPLEFTKQFVDANFHTFAAD